MASQITPGGPLFDLSLLPVEIVPHVIQYFPAEGIVSTLFVCKSWLDLASRAAEVRRWVYLERAKSEAKKLASLRDQCSAYLDIALVEGTFSPTQAKETVKKAKELVPLLDDVNSALTRILCVEATFDLPAAELTLLFIDADDHYALADAHILLAQFKPEGHLDLAKELLSEDQDNIRMLAENLVKVEARSNVEEAKKSIQRYEYGWVEEGWVEIVKQEAKLDQKRALTTALSIERIDTRAAAIRAFFFLMLPINWREAKKIALQIPLQGNLNDRSRDFALYALILEERKVSLEDAKETFLLLKDNYYIALAKLKIAEVDPTADLDKVIEESKKVAPTLGGDDRHHLMHEVVKIEFARERERFKGLFVNSN